jgi:transcriptional regulator with XRE-family HTH domain
MRTWLKKIRLEENMIQEQVANAVNISRNHYSRIETGARGKRLYPALAKKIAEALHFDKHGLDWTTFYER